MKKVFLLVLILASSIYLLASPVPTVQAAVCGEEIPKDASSLRTYIEYCEAKKSQLSGQAKTLAAAIEYLNTQIKLTQAKISATATQLDKVTLEIADLTSRISSIDYSLDDLQTIHLAGARDVYAS